MRKYIKTILVSIIIFSITIVISNGVLKLQKETSIDTILAGENYSYLPVEAKDYIKQVYEETGEVILTEKNKEENVPYLNPSYVSYLTLSETEKEEVELTPVPYLVDYMDLGIASSEELPSSFDLRNVNGKNYITPLKNQSTLGLCWGFATVEQAESYLMLTDDKPYDSTTKTFSVRQIDYGTSYNGINDYINENGYRNLATGGNFYMSSLLMSNGLSLIDDNLMPYDLNKEKKELSEVLNYNNSLYELDSSIMMPRLTASVGTEQYENYIDIVNESVSKYGGAYVSTGSPTGSCGSKNVDGKYIIVDSGNCHNSINYGAHAMQIIGWDDNYEYSYCQNGSTHGNVNSSGNCDKGILTSGKGAWLIRNSWGNNTPYVYLAYESKGSDIAMITSLSNEKSWDNNYHKNMYQEGIAGKTSDTATFSKKINTLEKLEKVKFMTISSSGKYTVSIVSDKNTYKNIKTVTVDYPGIYTIDLSDSNIILEGESFEVTIASTNSTYLMTNTISAFTSNIEKEPVIDLEDIKVTTNKMRLYSEVKNIPSGTSLIYKLYNSKNEDVSKMALFTNNVVAENNVNTLVDFSDDLDSGKYRLDIIYDSKVIKSIVVTINKMQGLGTKENPYIITTPYQLSQIRDDLNAYYELGNDIDLSESTKAGGNLSLSANTCPEGFGWEAINGFSGSLDGKGHTIKGLRQENYLTCTVSGDRWKTWTNTGNGIFASTSGNVSIKNLVLENFDITCQGKNCSVLVSNYSNDLADKTEYTATFENIVVKNSKIKGVYNSANNNSSYIYTYGGGLFGYLDSSNGNINISNIYLDLDMDSSDLKNNSYLIYQLNANHANIENIQLSGNFSGTYSGLNSSGLLIGQVFKNVTIRNVLSTVISTNKEEYLLGDVWADNVTIDNVNMLKLSDKGLCYRDDSKLCDGSTNVNIYDKDTELLELINKDNYKSWDNFNNNWMMRIVDGIPRIPVLSIADFEYLSIPNIILSHELNKKISIYDYITPKFIDTKMISFKSNDESIVKIDDNGNILPQSTGNTTIHIESLYDGYIHDVPINVTYVPHYNIVFDANGGTGSMDSVEVVLDKDYQLPKNSFVKENFVLKEWNTEPDGTGKSYQDLGQVSPRKDKETLTLYAQWIGEERIVTFDANGGVVTPNKKVVRYGETYGDLPIPTRDGYAFNYWYTGSVVVDSTDKIRGYNLVASWRENAYNIIYDANGGTLKKNYSGISNLYVMSDTLIVTTVNYNSTQSIIENEYERLGYKFKEWNTKPDGSGITYTENQEINLSSVEKSTLKLYAVWEFDKGIITYHSNDGLNQVVTQDFPFNVDTRLIQNSFIRLGYKFKEWNTEADGTGISYKDEQIINSFKNINLYAIWEEDYDYRINKYQVDKTNNYISQIIVNTTVENFKKNIDLNTNYTVEVDYKMVNNNQVLYTGGKTKILKNQNSYAEFTNVVMGDINGDGVINSADLLKIRQHLLGSNILTNANFRAADINDDELINSADLLRVRQHLLGSKPIS